MNLAEFDRDILGMDQHRNPKADLRPNAGQDRVVYAESTDYVYVYDHVNDWWEAWERADDDRDGVGCETGDLPDDAGPLFAPERWPHPETRRADAAEERLAKVLDIVKASAAMNAGDALDMLDVIGRVVDPKDTQ